MNHLPTESENTNTSAEPAPLRQRAARAASLLLTLPSEPTRDELESVIAALEALWTTPEICLLWRCPRCRADTWVLCVRPSGAELQHPFRRKPECHARRVDYGIAGFNSTAPGSWRFDLAGGGPNAVRSVTREIRRSVLAKQLMKLRASGLV